MCNVKLIACTVLYGKWKQNNKMGVVGARGFVKQYSSINTAREVFLFFFKGLRFLRALQFTSLADILQYMGIIHSRFVF